MPYVVKKNGSRTEFSSVKLRGSLELALRKRPVAAPAVDAAVASIEEKLLTSGQREVDTGYIGELVMQELKRLDNVAFIRFASVYKNFEDLAEFQNAIAEVGQERKPSRKS
ncbi:transcriptional repressor NrdR [Duganella sacchari]|uniref:Transcriptional repressor NrdR n=2 Tax=Telluria group TaxID=2895353 RepID=A0A1M7QGX6_9BURK|nr:transcriptional repressor NrdR [Duganella sacchari]